MPYKQDPLPREKIATIERWVAEGAKYDGTSPERGLDRPAAQDPARSRFPRRIPRPCRSRPWNSARDGATIAASGYHEITFWKTADGTLDRRLTGLAERIYDIAYSPDGKWMATASGDPGSLRRRQALAAEPRAACKPVRDLVETQDVVFSVAFSPDSKKIATAGADRTIRIFEVETGKLLVPDRRPRRLDLRGRLQPRRQAAGQRQPRQDRQGLRRREERVARHVPRPRPAGLHRLVHARRQGGRHRRRGQPHPRLEPRRRRQADPRDRRLRRHGLQAAVLARRQDPGRVQRRQTVRVFKPDTGRQSASCRATTTGSIRWRSRATARPSPREAGTARSGSGTSPTAS